MADSRRRLARCRRTKNAGTEHPTTFAARADDSPCQETSVSTSLSSSLKVASAANTAARRATSSATSASASPAQVRRAVSSAACRTSSR